jgi:hypothetical protein
MPAIQGIYHAADSGEEILCNLIILTSEWPRKKAPKCSGGEVVERNVRCERGNGKRSCHEDLTSELVT